MEDDLLSEFETFAISPDSKTLKRCAELCRKYSLDPETFVVDWVAFSSTRFNGEPPSSESLDVFERESLVRAEVEDKKPIPIHDDDLIIKNSQNIDQSFEEDDSILSVYGTPSTKNSTAKRLATPVSTPSNKRLTAVGRTPTTSSPTIFSPSTPSAGSQKFQTRTNAGEAVASYPVGCDVGSAWNENARGGWKPTVELVAEEGGALTSGYKYMFERLRDRVAAVEEQLLDVADHLAKRFSIDEWSSANAPSMEPIRCVGRIVCDANSGGKLNSASLLLESSAEFSSGQGVPLNCSAIREFSLFPGQVVAVEGRNPSGKMIVAEKLFTPEPLPLFDGPSDILPETGPLKIAVASGPFTLAEDLEFSPLEALLDKVNENPPHVLILVGPFLEVRNKTVESGLIGTTYEEEFQSVMEKLQAKVNSNVQIVIVSSARDVHHYPIYPTPPYTVHNQVTPNIRFVADPSVLNIAGVIVAVTSADVLLHLGKEEMSVSSQSSDRMGRLASHVINQRCFYPVWPPPEELSIDAEHWERYCKLPCTPHIMILPSDLRYFVKNVQGCLVVNPERAVKGSSGGFYARFVVESSGRVEAENIKADIVRI